MKYLRRLSTWTLLAAATQAFGGITDPALSINGEEVPRQKVQAQVDHLINERGLGSGGITQPVTYQQMQEEVVEQLIVQELLWQEAKRRELVISDEIVDARLAEIKEGFDTEQAFVFKIEAGGFTPESFRQTIREQLSVRRMIQEDIAQAINLDDKEVNAFYDENIEQMRRPLEVRARHVLIKPAATDETSITASRKDAEALLAEIRAGADFETLARERSDAPSAPDAGDLGYFRRGQMVPPFENAAFNMEPGDVSEVVQTQFGFHIIRVEDRRGGDVAPIEEVAENIHTYLARQRLEAEVEALVTRLRDEGDVKVFL